MQVQQRQHKVWQGPGLQPDSPLPGTQMATEEASFRQQLPSRLAALAEMF